MPDMNTLASAVLNIKDLVSYQTGSVVSRTLIDKSVGTVTVFASNSHYVPKRAILNGIEGFTGSIGGSVTHICVAFSARRAPASCFLGLLGSFRAH